MPVQAAARPSASPSVGGLPPVTPRGTLNSGRESGGLPSSSLSVRTFPLLHPAPDWDGDPGAQLCEGGPCLWLFSPYLVRELHAAFLAPPGASEWQPGVEWGGEAGTSTHARLGSTAAPRPYHCPSLLLGKGSLQTGAAAQADGIGIACQTVGPPCTASLSATATLSEGGCLFSGSFVSVRGTHMGWGGA